MATLVEELLIGLGYEFDDEDSKQFRKDAQLVSSAINQISVASGVALAALTAMATTTASTTDELGKNASVMDTSVEALARWRHAAEIAGSDGDKVVDTLANLRAAAQGALSLGAGAPFEAFAALGVDLEGLADGTVDVSDALLDIINNARDLDRALAQTALRDLGIDPLLLEQTPEQLQRSFEEADRFSGVTTELAGKAADFNDEWQRTLLLLSGTGNLIGQELLPAFTNLFREVNNFLMWVQSDGVPIINQMVEALGGWEAVIVGLGTAALLTPLIAGFTTILTIINAAKLGLAALAATAVKTGAALGPVLAVAGAGAAGTAVGGAIQERLSPETSDLIGGGVARILSLFGVEEAQEAIRLRQRAAGEADLTTTGDAPVTAPPVTTPTRTLEGVPEPFDVPVFEQPEQVNEFDVPQAPPVVVEPETPQPPNIDMGAFNTFMEQLTIPAALPGQSSVDTAGAADIIPMMTTTIQETLPDQAVADVLTQPPANILPTPQQVAAGEQTVIRQSGDRTSNVTNNFNGMRLSDVEALLARKEREQNEFMDEEAQDAIVR